MFAAAAALAAAVGITVGGGGASAAAPASAPCTLSNGIQHVIYLQFDNTHFRRDNPNVASDLEQMPHLLNFLKGNGTLFTNDHTILISHTAGGILSSLTGLYPDRTGINVSNSYDYFPPSKVPAFTSAFKYWTDPVDATNDTLPNMITDGQKNTPAPWVPFTRAGCDVGGVGTANIELENANTSASGDITKVFGNPSPQFTEAGANPHLAQTDFVGIAIHCSQATTSRCNANTNARADALPDEPGGYTGYQGLFGAKYVDPAITGGSPAVNDTAGQPITDPDNNPGFPGFDGMLAKNTLGYVEQMQENGVPVTYGYISDAHDFHVPNTVTDAYSSSATGPGEATHNQQLAAYDLAFQQFFTNLAAHGIDRSNTLFVVTVDEGDHFAGGVGTPQPDGTLAYSHTTCTNLSACPANQIGEVDANMNALLPAADQNAPFPATVKYDISHDDAPSFYLTGNPAPGSAIARQYERDAAALTSLDPYVRDANGVVQTIPLAERLADPTELKALHMINTDPNRTPTFTMFGNPDFFFQTSNPCTGFAECASPGFAWNHGDFQDEIGNTWVGIVGPGVENNGVDAQTWTDHTNLRPTIMALTGLKDDYETDGRVLVEAVRSNDRPHTLNGAHVLQLGDVYEQLNAPFGSFAMDTLQASTNALASGSSANDSTYTSTEAALTSLISQRDALAKQIKDALYGAAFNDQKIDEQAAKSWIDQANQLIAQANALS
jgi:hypothetical protein